MLIELLEEDWRNALQSRNSSSFNTIPSSQYCPIACALKRTFGVQFAQVTNWTIVVGMFPDNIIFKILTPLFIRKWLTEFDNGLWRNFTPFSFELELPSDVPIC